MYEEPDGDALADRLIQAAMPGESELTKSIVRAFARLPDSEWERLRDLVEDIKKAGSL